MILRENFLLKILNQYIKYLCFFNNTKVQNISESTKHFREKFSRKLFVNLLVINTKIF